MSISGKNGKSYIVLVTRIAGTGLQSLKVLAVNGAGHPAAVGHMIA